MNKKTPKQSRSKTSKKQTIEQVLETALDETITLEAELTANAKAEAVESLAEVKAINGSMADIVNMPEIETLIEEAKNPLQHRDEDLMLENMEQDIQDFDKCLGEGLKQQGLGYEKLVEILALSEGRVSASGKARMLKYVTRNKFRSEGVKESEYYKKNQSIRGMVKNAFDSVIDDSLNALEEADRLRLNGVGTITTGENAMPRFDATEPEAVLTESQKQDLKDEQDENARILASKIETKHKTWFWNLSDEEVDDLVEGRILHLEDVANKTAEKEAKALLDSSPIVIDVNGEDVVEAVAIINAEAEAEAIDINGDFGVGAVEIGSEAEIAEAIAEAEAVA